MNPRKPRGDAHDAYDDNYDDTPLQHQKPFGGAGLKRKRSVAFVRATDPELQTTRDAQAVARGSAISDAYLKLVLKKNPSERSTTPAPNNNDASSSPATTTPCPVCNLPIDQASTADHIKKHEASIAHQVCLTHSHPPSAIDRSRMGLKNLESYGWDPDSRLGLGAEGQGIRDPLKAKPKDDTLGLGLVISKEAMEKARVARKKPKKLNIKEMRKMQAEEKRRGERLKEMFYAKDDVLKYLGRGL